MDEKGREAYERMYMGYVKRVMWCVIPPASVLAYACTEVFAAVGFAVCAFMVCAAYMYCKKAKGKEGEEGYKAARQKMVERSLPVAASLLVGFILGAVCANEIGRHAHIIYERFSEDEFHVFR